MIDCYTAIKTSTFNLFKNIHAWIYDINLLIGSKFIEMIGGNGNFKGFGIYSDTYHYTFYSSGSNIPHVQISNSFIFYNKNIMSDSVMGSNVPYIFYSESEVDNINSRRLLISNSEICGIVINNNKTKLTNQTFFEGSLSNCIMYNTDNSLPIAKFVNVESSITEITNKIKKDSMVIEANFVGSIDTDSLSSRSINMAQLPYNYRPDEPLNTFICYGDGEWNVTGIIYAYINTNGDIQVVIPSGITGKIYLKAHFTYLTNKL